MDGCEFRRGGVLLLLFESSPARPFGFAQGPEPVDGELRDPRLLARATYGSRLSILLLQIAAHGYCDFDPFKFLPFPESPACFVGFIDKN